jgi:hypothetical protein
MAKVAFRFSGQDVVGTINKNALSRLYIAIYNRLLQMVYMVYALQHPARLLVLPSEYAVSVVQLAVKRETECLQ